MTGGAETWARYRYDTVRYGTIPLGTKGHDGMETVKAQPWEEDMENEMMEHELWAGGREPFGDG